MARKNAPEVIHVFAQLPSVQVYLNTEMHADVARRDKQAQRHVHIKRSGLHEDQTMLY